MAGDDSPGRKAQETHDGRVALVEEHIRQENRHDLEAVMATFGTAPTCEDTPWHEHHTGRNDVQTYYDELLHAIPDLHIDIQDSHVTDEQVIQEVIISGTHLGSWRGLLATGRQIEFPLCAVYSFDDEGKLAGERIYYDRATVLRQLGVFHEPDRGLGRLLTPLTHPLTIARAIWRTVRGSQ